MTKGYIYTMYKGADPGRGWQMSDPIFRPRPTLGACMPNIRRFVLPGDQIFVVSGRCDGVSQFVVGGFAVDEKIHALAAYRRFPELRQRVDENGNLAGNIIVQADGSQHPADYHTNFESRLDNYIVGRDPIVLESEEEVRRGREQSLDILRRIFGKPQARKISEVIGRTRRLELDQIIELRAALAEIKAGAHRANR